MNLISSIVTLSLIYATPIIITALGGLYSERSGIVNIALEGIMVIGAFVAATFTPLNEAALGAWTPWIAILLGAIMGCLYSLIHAFVSIDLQADQVISGTALNMLSLGITVYFCQIIFNQQRTETFNIGFVKTNVPFFSDIPIIGDLFFKRMYYTFYLAILLVLVTAFILRRTRFGLRLKASGEHPSAVDSVGVSVRKMRYTGVLISGFLAGLSGGIMVLTQATQFTAGSIHGVGFISLAALIFGRWNAYGVLGAGIFFGFSQIFAIFSKDIPLLANVPSEVFRALPYILTIIAILLFSRRSAGPKASGEIYDVSKR